MSKYFNKPALITCVALGLAVAGSTLAIDKLAILSEGATAGVWRPVAGNSLAVPAYPATLADKSEDVCVSLGYLLKADGSTSDFALLTAWGSKTPTGGIESGHFDAFSLEAANAVHKWHFAPVDGGHANIVQLYTAASFAFTTNAETDKLQLRARCVVADLPEFVRKAQEDAYKRGNLSKGQMQRDRVQNPPVIQPPAQR